MSIMCTRYALEGGRFTPAIEELSEEEFYRNAGWWVTWAELDLEQRKLRTPEDDGILYLIIARKAGKVAAVLVMERSDYLGHGFWLR